MHIIARYKQLITLPYGNRPNLITVYCLTAQTYLCSRSLFMQELLNLAWGAKLYYADVMPYLALDLPGLGNSRQITGSHHHCPAMETSSTSCCDSVNELTQTHVVVKNWGSNSVFLFLWVSQVLLLQAYMVAVYMSDVSYMTISFLVVSSIMYLVQSFQFS